MGGSPPSAVFDPLPAIESLLPPRSPPAAGPRPSAPAGWTPSASPRSPRRPSRGSLAAIHCHAHCRRGEHPDAGSGERPAPAKRSAAPPDAGDAGTAGTAEFRPNRCSASGLPDQGTSHNSACYTTLPLSSRPAALNRKRSVASPANAPRPSALAPSPQSWGGRAGRPPVARRAAAARLSHGFAPCGLQGRLSAIHGDAICGQPSGPPRGGRFGARPRPVASPHPRFAPP